MSKLFLVRHAEPAATGVLLGQANPPLSSAGRAAAARIRLPVRLVYSSPLRRAVETAAQWGLRTLVLHDLAEISYGEWDGLSWNDIESKYPELSSRKQADWRRVTPPGAEDWDAFSNRVARALDVIRSGPFPAAVVAHAAVNAELARLLCGVDPLSFEQDYCGVFEYEIAP
jgi:alpha-ribazole phosphatase/probable phosphoglycerate mutase